ncbi:MAG TPA: BON domain-containing protein [Fimbriiglobus sp.]
MHLLHTLLNPRLAVAIATALGTCGFGVSAEPPGFGSNDAVQLKAKAALEKDPVLKNLNLWLSVSDGVVLVNGGVPDEVTKGKIEAVLAKVPGVSVVRVTAWVAPAEDPIRKLVEDRLVGVPDAPLPNKYAAPSLAVNPILPGAVPDEIPGLPVGIGAVPSPASRPTGTVVAQRFDPASVGGFLQPPVVATNGSATLPPGFDVPPPPVGPAAYPTIRATRVPVAPVELSPADAALELLAVRKSDPRFAGLIAVLRNGSALVTGSAATRADAEAFAGAVGKVPGVGRVAVGSIQIR